MAADDGKFWTHGRRRHGSPVRSAGPAPAAGLARGRRDGSALTVDGGHCSPVLPPL